MTSLPAMDSHFTREQRNYLEHHLLQDLTVISLHLQHMARNADISNHTILKPLIQAHCQKALEAVDRLEQRVRELAGRGNHETAH